MKYTIENNGHGYINVRLTAPQELLSQCLDFINSLDKKSTNKTTKIKKASCLRDDNYFIKLDQDAISFFNDFVQSGQSKSVAFSNTLKKMKGINYTNITYDILKSRLIRQGCFRSKNQ